MPLDSNCLNSKSPWFWSGPSREQRRGNLYLTLMEGARDLEEGSMSVWFGLVMEMIQVIALALGSK